ncbi:NADH oxidase, partial [Xanthomonas citri pv. citri]|nr:NADH oxidase [Xanthomonas citri pv. citri]
GRGVHPDLIKGEYGLAPTPLPIPGQYPYLKEMDQRDIENIISDYVDCSVRLKKAQFDGVNIHAAHGNLLAAFLSPLTNHRVDSYGG